MPSDKMIWVLLALGIASGFFFMTEDFVEGLRDIWEMVRRCLAPGLVEVATGEERVLTPRFIRKPRVPHRSSGQGPSGQAKVQVTVWLEGQLSFGLRGETLALAPEPETEFETPASLRYPAHKSGVAMSVERRIIFGLEDIKAVTFACYACNARVSFSPNELIRIPQHCHCGQRWVIGDVPTNSPFRKLTDALYAARNTIKPETAGFRLLLEFEEPASVPRHDALAAKS